MKEQEVTQLDEPAVRQFGWQLRAWVATLAIATGVLALCGWAFDVTVFKSIRLDWVSVKPNAAVAFILVGVALVFSRPARQPSAALVLLSRIARWLGWLAGLIGLLTLIEYAWGWNPGFDQWLFHEPSHAVGTSHSGRMALDSAFCFVLLAAGMEISRHARKPDWVMRTTTIFGALVTTVAAVEMLSYLTPSLRAYGWGGLTMMAFPTAITLAALGAALALGTWHEQMLAVDAPSARFALLDRRTGFLFLLVLFFLTVGILAIGTSSYRLYERHLRDNSERQLYTVAALKVTELTQFRRERVADAAVFFKNPVFSGLVRSFFEHPQDGPVQEQLRAWLARYQDDYRYHNVVLLDGQGVERLTARAAAPLLGTAVLRGARKVLRSREIAVQDFYREERDQQVYLAVLAPVLDESADSSALGVIVLQIDPARFFYPLLKRWPTFSRSAETLLVRQEGSEVLYLNELRFQTNSTMNLRAPLDQVTLPAAQAAVGREGIMDGIDYRGVPVVAALRSIPDSPWALVAQMEVAEVYAPLRERFWQAIVLIGILFFGVVSCVGLIWRQQAVRHFRQQAEAAKQLRDSKVQYRRLMETAKDGVLILDAATGQVVDVNQYLLEMWGCSRELLLGKPIWELGYFKDIVASPERFADLKAKGYVRYDDLLWETADGRQVLVEFVSNVYAVGHRQVIQCNIRDISARRQAEAALRASEDRFRTLADMAPEAIFIETNLRFAYINAAGVRLLGATGPEEILGQPVLDRLHPNYHDRVHERNRLLYEQFRDVPALDEVYLRMDGTTVDVSVSAVPFTYQGQNGALAFVHDITERKRAEQQLRDSNRQLSEALTELRQTQRQIIQQENLRALGQMASGIAHDFNNALAPILGFSELLLTKPDAIADQKKVTKYLQIINTCANDAAGVVRQMREFGRKRETAAGDKQTHNLAELVLQTIEHTRPRWKDQAQAAGVFIQVKTDLQKVPPLIGEEFAFREILTNLIINAVDAMPAGGTITLGTAVEGEFVRLWVRDTGAGMTEEVRQRCFEPFFTTKGAHGTGLGLTTLYGIVQRHGGTVEVESKLGQGTTFIIRLPINLTKTAPAVGPVPVAAALPRKLHVLVVDDDPSLCDVAEASLTNDGHTAEIAYDGKMALKLLQEGRFDVVLTDKAMPEINGEQLAAAIHLIAPDLPVILMTGFGDLMKTAGEKPPHISEILSKPFTLAMLRAALGRALATGSGQPPQV